MSKWLFVLFLITLTWIIVLTVIIINGNMHHKTGYVVLQEVYNDFQLKKKLDKDLKELEDRKKSLLDSMMTNIDLMSQKMKRDPDNKTVADSIDVEKRKYLYKKKSFEQENESVASNYTQQIWKQINLYVNEYGKKNGYDFILGAEGSGAVMFASEAKNITNEIREYVRVKYSGSN